MEIDGQLNVTFIKDGITETIQPTNYKRTKQGICINEKNYSFGDICDNT